MSLETWKAEFYPIEAKDVPIEQAIAHSLKKWEGLTAENLEKHALIGAEGTTISDGTLSLRIDSECCALCVHYLDNEDEKQCPKCPLSLYNGGRCDNMNEDNVNLYFEGLCNPLIMITALKETLKANS